MNDDKRKKEIRKAAILLDKLVFNCKSIVEDNFNYAVENIPEHFNKIEFRFNHTKLIRCQDPSNRFKHSFRVCHQDIQIGHIDFNMYGNTFNDLIRFTVHNEAFYNDGLKFIPDALNDLCLEIHNFTKIDIAMDCYDYDIEQVIRRHLRKKDNQIKLLGRIIYDRNQIQKNITYYNHGSLNNQFKVRSILIKNKKGTFELACYNKTEEIRYSKKEYINSYHKKNNPEFKKLYRIEIRLKYDEIHRYIKKKQIFTLQNMMDSLFLYKIFTEYLDRTITFFSNENKKKREKIFFLPIP